MLPYSVAALGHGEYRGMIEVQIDENGDVTNAKIIQSVQPIYDPILLSAARSWKYEAPRIAGRPTPINKRVQIVLKP